MADLRKPTKEEFRLLKQLVDLSDLLIDINWEKTY